MENDQSNTGAKTMKLWESYEDVWKDYCTEQPKLQDVTLDLQMIAALNKYIGKALSTPGFCPETDGARPHLESMWKWLNDRAKHFDLPPCPYVPTIDSKHIGKIKEPARQI